MAHYRPRHVKVPFQKVMPYSPLVGIFGHRQVGKTSFIEQLTSNYVSFDQKSHREDAARDPDLFVRTLLRAGTPAIIDECQTVADLFPALKEHVRKHKKPGQVVLSGSVRFYSRQAIRESLTGRIVNLELLPLSLTELGELPRARLPLKLMSKNTLTPDLVGHLSARVLRKHSKLIDSYLECGGLPGICFLRNERLRSEKLREQLNLILDRDLRLVYPTTLSYSQLSEYIRALARLEGELVVPTLLRKQTGIAETTQAKLLNALEAIFLIRVLAIEGDRKGRVVFFEDQAEHSFLYEARPEEERAFESLVFRNLYAVFNYETGCDFRVFQFRKRPDIRIPMAFKTKDGCLGVIPMIGEAPSRQALRSARAFLQTYSPALVVFVTRGLTDTSILEPRILRIPAERLLFEE